MKLELLQVLILLIFLNLFLISAERNHEWRCAIPDPMKGTYRDYHRHFKTDKDRRTNGHVNIHNNRISNRGECVINRGDYYLIYNKRKNCYSCMLMQLKHANIIRYKETSCDGAIHFSNFEDICSNIGSGYLWDMLIRSPLTHHHCIFRDHKIRFTYTDINHAHCTNGVFSLAEMHADRTRVKLHFDHCVPNAMYNNKVMSISCIGEWQYGEDSNMIVEIINEEDEEEDDDDYNNLRCIKYSKKHSHDIYRTLITNMSVASSWDCGLLHNATTGALVLNFIEDTVYSPKLTCAFPEWLYQNTWNDFIGSLFFKSSQSNDFKVYSYHPLTNQKSLRRVFSCYLMVDYFLLDDEFTFVSLTTSEWSTNLQCLMFQKKSKHVAILKEGPYLERGQERRCFEEEYTFMYIATSGDLENEHVRVVDYDNDPEDFDVENNNNNNNENKNNNNNDIPIENDYNKKINSDNRHYYVYNGDNFNNQHNLNAYDYNDNINYNHHHHHHHYKLHYYPPIECPFHSFHHSLSHQDCVHRVDFACVWPFIVHFEPLCVSKLPRSKFQCIDWWKKSPENDVIVILMQELLSKTLFCMQLDIKSHTLSVSCDEEEKYNKLTGSNNNNRNNNNNVNNTSYSSKDDIIKLQYTYLNDSHVHNLLLPQYSLFRDEPCNHPATDSYRGAILPWSLDYFQQLEAQQIKRLKVLYHSLERRCFNGDCGTRSGGNVFDKNNEKINNFNEKKYHNNPNAKNMNNHRNAAWFEKRLKTRARQQEQQFVNNYYSSPFYHTQKQLQETAWLQNYRHQGEKILNRYQRNKIDASWSNNASKLFALPTTKTKLVYGNFSFPKFERLSNFLNFAVFVNENIGGNLTEANTKEFNKNQQKVNDGNTTMKDQERTKDQEIEKINNLTNNKLQNTTIQKNKIEIHFNKIKLIIRNKTKMKTFLKKIRSAEMARKLDLLKHPLSHHLRFPHSYFTSTTHTTVKISTNTTEKIFLATTQSEIQTDVQKPANKTKQTATQIPTKTSTLQTLEKTHKAALHLTRPEAGIPMMVVEKQHETQTPPQNFISREEKSRQTYKKDHFIYNTFDQGVEGFYSGVKKFEMFTKLLQDSLLNCTFKQFHCIQVYILTSFIFMF